MVTEEDFKKANIVPKIKNINLKYLAEFYFQELTKKSYKYKVRLHKSKNEFDMDIRFYNENLPHLLGIHKIPKSTYKYTGEQGYNNIINEKITIKSSMDLDKGLRPVKSERKFQGIADRITHFFYLLNF